MTRSFVRPRGVAAAFALLPMWVAADASNPQDGRRHEKRLDEIAVTANPLGTVSAEAAKPAAVLASGELEDRRRGTIGETVSEVPGVQSSYFGPGVGRPVIRGQDGARVQVLSGGTGALDASTVSVDHALTIEPFVAEQLEVLKGPSTLFYGAGAIGGVAFADGGNGYIGLALSGYNTLYGIPGGAHAHEEGEDHDAEAEAVRIDMYQ